MQCSTPGDSDTCPGLPCVSWLRQPLARRCVLQLYTAARNSPLRLSLQVTIFSDVLADLGDSQSLEQSLSTFSGHMQQVTGILRDAGPRSLVLLDELGSGTDPTEGAPPPGGRLCILS